MRAFHLAPSRSGDSRLFRRQFVSMYRILFSRWPRSFRRFTLLSPRHPGSISMTPVNSANRPTARPRAILLLVLIASPTLSATAQVAAPVAAEEPVTLSPFVLREDQDTGYAPNETLSGTRLRTQTKDVA